VEKQIEAYNLEDFLNKITQGDCLELIKIIPDNKIDCIITDPPYGLNKNGIKNDKDLSLFYNILPECYRVLKEDAFFATFFSTKHLPDLFKNNPLRIFGNLSYTVQRGVFGPLSDLLSICLVLCSKKVTQN